MAIASLITHGTSPNIPEAMATQWYHWDSLHYVFVAANGYSKGADAGNVIVWLPLYPMLVRLVGATGLDLRLAMLVVNSLASLVGTVVLYELARVDQDDRAAWRAAVFWNIFPTSYFLFNGYTEGLFGALTFGAVLALRRRWWVVGGVLGALATATRLNGLALVPYAAVEILIAARSLTDFVEPIFSLALIPIGFLSFLYLNQRVYGQPLAFMEVQKVNFHHEINPPWVGAQGSWLIFGYKDFLSAGKDQWGRLLVGLSELMGGIVFYVMLVLTALKLRWSDVAYVAGMIVMTTFVGFWLSNPRYLLGLYPLFLLGGRVENRGLQIAGAVLSFAAMIRLAIAFSLGIWAF